MLKDVCCQLLNLCMFCMYLEIESGRYVCQTSDLAATHHLTDSRSCSIGNITASGLIKRMLCILSVAGWKLQAQTGVNTYSQNNRTPTLTSIF